MLRKLVRWPFLISPHHFDHGIGGYVGSNDVRTFSMRLELRNYESADGPKDFIRVIVVRLIAANIEDSDSLSSTVLLALCDVLGFGRLLVELVLDLHLEITTFREIVDEGIFRRSSDAIQEHLVHVPYYLHHLLHTLLRVDH